MPLWKALVLGVVQGLTEFLPVSSSGHLVIAEKLLGVSLPGVRFELWVHLGTLLAVVAVYWRDLLGVATAFAEGLRAPAARDRSEFRLAVGILVGTLATAVIGLVFMPVFERLFESVRSVGYELIVTGWILFLTSRRDGRRSLGDLRIGDALFVGVAQGLAIAPGISRSGTTIGAGLLRNLRGTEAARFSFLLSVPAIVGAALFDALTAPPVAQLSGAALAVGAGAAAVSGYVAIRALLDFLARLGLRPFAYYCWTVGLLTVLFS